MTEAVTVARVDAADAAGLTGPAAVPRPASSALTRERAIGLIQGLLADGIISGVDLRAFVPSANDPLDPESLRQDYESWFKSVGVEATTGRPLSLGRCPFTRDELATAAADGWIPVVSPKGLTAHELAEAFRFRTWATTDLLVTAPPEEEDLWFLTPGDLKPADPNLSARDIRRRYESSGMLGLSLQRYLIVVARLRHLTGQLPDYRWWVWIMRGRYDRSGYLIAGFDPNRMFSVHAWMPSFRASFVGSRRIRICERIAHPSDHRSSG